MRIQLPKFDNQSFINDLIPTHAVGMWNKAQKERSRKIFQKTTETLVSRFPLQTGKTEDQVVEAVLNFLNEIGWKAKDKRSTFIEGTSHKPDIWLDNRIVFVEALSYPAKFNQQSWIEHCSRTVEYSKYAASRIGICTDGRRWFVASSLEGELKTTFIDLKKFEKGSAEVNLLSALL